MHCFLICLKLVHFYKTRHFSWRLWKTNTIIQFREFPQTRKCVRICSLMMYHAMRHAKLADKLAFGVYHEEHWIPDIAQIVIVNSLLDYLKEWVYAKGAHLFEASKELIMLWCKVCPFSNIATYIAKGAHLGHLSSKFIKVAPWIFKSRLTDKSSRY